MLELLNVARVDLVHVAEFSLHFDSLVLDFTLRLVVLVEYLRILGLILFVQVGQGFVLLIQ